MDSPLQTERLNAIESLAALVAKYPVAQEKLAEAVQNADYPDVRVHAAFLLVQFKDVRAVPQLLEALSNKSQTIRLTKLFDLMKTEAVINSQAFPLDANLPLCYVAAWALGYIKDGNTVQEIAKFLHDEDSRMRGFVVLAIGQIGDVNATQYLWESLSDEDRKVCQFTARALGWIGGSMAVPNLVNVMHNDIDFDVREAATWALGQIGDAKAVPDLITALYSKSYEVRDRAAEALKQIGTSEALDALAIADNLSKSQKVASSVISDG